MQATLGESNLCAVQIGFPPERVSRPHQKREQVPNAEKKAENSAEKRIAAASASAFFVPELSGRVSRGVEELRELVLHRRAAASVARRRQTGQTGRLASHSYPLRGNYPAAAG